MKLDEFITESLKSIIKGIDDTKDFAIEHQARINPYVGKWDLEKTDTTYYGREDGARRVSVINFDIAISVSDSVEKDRNAGLKVYALNLGGKSKDKLINETISRIQFDLSVSLPNTKDD